MPDALASAAKQLEGKGWQRGLRWAYEVHPPANVDCTMGVPDITLPIGEWLKRGFVPAYGRTLSAAERAEPASLLQPAGLYGPSFLVTKNYFVIKEYNFSDLYVLFVGHLSDRITDPRPFETPWSKSRATADRRARPHAAHPHRPRLLPRQDRRQGRHADPLRARRLSEAQRAEGRLLADGRGVGAYGSQQELTKSRAVSTMREEPLMQIKAAVVRERSGPFAIETVELCEPRPDEVIVRVVASGMCQTDLHGRDGYFDSPYPAVYGHEGAGIVHAVGDAVRALAPGDHVVMSYPWCGACANCRQQRQNYCVHGRSLKSGGTRADGSTLLAKNGAPVYSAFFQQSSFGTFALSQERYTVKVRNDAPLELLGPLACSGQTGAGAVLNVMKPVAGESIAIFGVGAVGIVGADGGENRRLRSDHCGGRSRLAAGARPRARRYPYDQPQCLRRRGRRNSQDQRWRRALLAGNVGRAGGFPRGHRSPHAGGHLRAARQRPQGQRSCRSKCRSCSKAAPSAASFRATACRRSSSQSSST